MSAKLRELPTCEQVDSMQKDSNLAMANLLAALLLKDRWAMQEWLSTAPVLLSVCDTSEVCTGGDRHSTQQAAACAAVVYKACLVPQPCVENIAFSTAISTATLAARLSSSTAFSSPGILCPVAAYLAAPDGQSERLCLTHEPVARQGQECRAYMIHNAAVCDRVQGQLMWIVLTSRSCNWLCCM